MIKDNSREMLKLNVLNYNNCCQSTANSRGILVIDCIRQDIELRG